MTSKNNILAIADTKSKMLGKSTTRLTFRAMTLDKSDFVDERGID